MTDKKIQINEGVVKKGNTGSPPAQGRPPSPSGQAPRGTGSGSTTGSSGSKTSGS